MNNQGLILFQSRQRQGHSLRDAAAKLQMSHTYVTKLEQREVLRELPYPTLKRVAAYCGHASVEAFLKAEPAPEGAPACESVGESDRTEA